MKKKIIIVLLALLLLFVLAGLSPFNFPLYRLSYTLSIYSSSKSEMKDTNGNRETFDVDRTNSYRVIIHGLNDDNIYLNNGSTGDINVYVTKSNLIGLSRFIPIFKSIEFNSSISYRWATPMNKGIQSSISDSGSFDIRGRYHISGICSAKKAEQLIMNTIFELAKKKINEDIRKRLVFKTN